MIDLLFPSFIFIIFSFFILFCLCFLFTVEAATKIQAVFRGHKVRANMKQGDDKTSDNNTTEREPTKEELEAEFDLDDEGNNFFILFLTCKSYRYPNRYILTADL